jgi:hypothetical protein
MVPNTRQADAGFTLIEVLIALAIDDTPYRVLSWHDVFDDPSGALQQWR